ncbi:MAG: efflux RND transporter periplasmic adaptor subunit [Acidobacteriota bacterium]
MTGTNDERTGARDAPSSPEEKRSDPLALPPPTTGMRRFSAAVFILLGAGLIAFVLINPLSIPFLPGFGRSDGRAEVTGADRTDGQETWLYQCPMHPEVIEPEPGDCPICGMKLEPIQADGRTSAASERAGDGSGGEREVLYWYAPMDPTYVSDRPGLSPMGMKLVPKYKDEAGDEEGIIRIDPAQVQNIGVISEPARRSDLTRVIRTVGILDFDADNVYWINTKYSGWIEKVHVNYVGQEIRKGQPLFEIYSPELVTTQEEYLRALEYRDLLAGTSRAEVLRQAENLLRSTRQRLEYWDISENQISALERSRRVQRALQVTSPVDGVVVEVMDEALEGMFVEPGMNLYRLADLSSIWVHVDAYESDIAWIGQGHPAEVQLSYFPDKVFRGKVLFMYPELDQRTRTVKVCVEIPNPRLRLKPGMYANVRIKGEVMKDVVAVPDSAILRSGERNVVFIELGDGRFLPREVEIGLQGEDNLVEIRKGLTGTERVVVQAQFMLDSESRVQEAIRKFAGGGRKPAAEPGAPPAQPPRPEHVH